MKRSQNRFTDILIVVIISCFIGMISGAAAIISINNKKEEKLNTSDFSEVSALYEKILNEYYTDVDEQTLIQGAMSGMLSTLDINSSFLDQSATTNFNNRMKGEYYGIGIEALTLDDVGVLVVGVLEDSPAEKAGIKDGDIILSVNDISLKGKTASYFTSLVNSLEKDLKIKITRDDKTLDFNLSAEKIIINSVTTNTFSKEGKNVGYIKISIFAANTASQFTTKLQDLESSGIDSLIIDVRDNAGGYLSNAATILELFMKKGTVLYQTATKDATTKRKDLTDTYRSYPVVILVNGSSASASEVLAASFQDNYGSDLIGTTTYGKGTVQETISVLEGSSTAKITTKKWLTPKGIWINGKGLEPTIKVEINDKYLTNPIFENDNQLSVGLNTIVKK
jgi:carboxyl-terminal processing protease